jgi:site-specific DNA recombinase
VCSPKKAWLPEGHPPSTYWVREDNLLDGLTKFLAQHVFGPYRRQLLDANLKTIDENAQHERRQRIAALRRSITDTEVKSRRLVRSLEVAGEVDQGLIRDINERRAELRAERAGLHADSPASDQRFSSGMLVIEASFKVDRPIGDA